MQHDYLLLSSKTKSKAPDFSAHIIKVIQGLDLTGRDINPQ